MKRLLWNVGILINTIIFSSADEINHRYKPADEVNFYVHKVGPYANPQEAYEYYNLPYCAPLNEHHPDNSKGSTKQGLFNQLKSASVGEYLGGHALRHSGHSLRFASSATKEKCKNDHILTNEEAEKFSNAAENQWFYQMYIDDLPVWGMVGEMMDPTEKVASKKGKDKEEGFAKLKPFIYTSRTLTILYNKDRIVKVDLASHPSSLVPIEKGVSLSFEMSIVWKETKDEFHSRFDRYLDHAFFKHQIHWFSLFNSFMMVLFLTGLVSLIMLRTLKRDYARYSIDMEIDSGGANELDDGVEDENGKPLLADEGGSGKSKRIGIEESGWKQVHGDVFRAPAQLPLFAAILGTGWQLVVLTLGVILFALSGPLHGEVHESRGEIQHAVIICYSLSSIVAGYFSGSYFKKYHTTVGGSRGKASGTSSDSQWQASMFLTVMLLPTVTVTTFSVLNLFSLIYGTINYIPFLVIVKLLLMWIFTSVPLCIVGTMAGRHTKVGSGNVGKGLVTGSVFPCRVNAIPRLIPEPSSWYGKPSNLIPFAGLLSFGSIFIELYYILTSLWNYKFYHVYGFLFGVYGILAIVVSMTTIIVVYFSLNAENYHWQWTSFASGANTAVYVFIYGVYYFIFKTQMTGVLQTVYYFGYMGLMALNIGTLCGTIGHYAATCFVGSIFKNVKLD